MGAVAAGAVGRDFIVHVGGQQATGVVDVVQAAAGAQPSSAPKVSEFGAVDLGVHRSLENRDQAEGLPAYIPRRHDKQVRDQLMQGRSQPTLLTVVGESSCGKTRTMYEAVHALYPDNPLLYPRSPAELVNLLEKGLPPNVVLWLDELQEHLVGRYGELVVTHLEKLLTSPGVRPFCAAASIWPRNLNRLKRPDSDQAYGPVARFLRRFADCEVHVPTDFDEVADGELDRIAAQDSRLAQAVKGSGTRRITQILAGGVFLLDSYLYRFSPVAKAVTTAAMDLRLIGYPNPVDLRVLHLVAGTYLAPAERIQPIDWVDEGLAEATAEDRGLRALTPVRVDQNPGTSPDSVDVHDYLFEYHTRTRTDVAPSEAFWRILSKEADNGLMPRNVATSAGYFADSNGLDGVAIDLLTYAGDAGDRYAEVALGHLLAKRRDVDALRSRATKGDRSARYHLAEYLFNTRNEKELVERAAAGDWYANESYLRLLSEQQNVQELTKLADEGNSSADQLLASTLRAMENIALLTSRTDKGNLPAAKQLADHYVETADVDGLRLRAESGNVFEFALMNLWLASDNEAGLIEAAERGSRLAVNRLGDMYYQRGDLTSLRLWAGRVESYKNISAKSWHLVTGTNDIDVSLNLLLWDIGLQEEVRENAKSGSTAAKDVLAMHDTEGGRHQIESVGEAHRLSLRPPRRN